MTTKKERIWELDALRGFAVVAMIAVHFIYDLDVLCGIPFAESSFYNFIKQNGGLIFVLISGVCVTLGTKTVKRGAVVFACGLSISAATRLLYELEVTVDIVRFGILSLLGVCMLLWPLFSPRSASFLFIGGALIIAAGYLIVPLRVSWRFLYPLGLIYKNFYSADYFPLFPYLGYFLVGSAAGKVLYRKKTSLLPKFKYTFPLLRTVGKNSLVIYLVHQPVLYVVCMLINHILY